MGSESSLTFRFSPISTFQLGQDDHRVNSYNWSPWTWQRYPPIDIQVTNWLNLSCFRCVFPSLWLGRLLVRIWRQRSRWCRSPFYFAQGQVLMCWYKVKIVMMVIMQKIIDCQLHKMAVTRLQRSKLINTRCVKQLRHGNQFIFRSRFDKSSHHQQLFRHHQQSLYHRYPRPWLSLSSLSPSSINFPRLLTT